MAKAPKHKIPEEREYGEEEEEEENLPISIAEPMTFWITLLVIALIFKIALSYANPFSASASAHFAGTIANYILFLPGSLILPIIVGAVIGVRVGDCVRRKRDILAKGLMNGVYASIIYMLSIIIIYAVFVYAMPASAPGIAFLSTQWLAIPIAIEIVLAVLFSVLTFSRK